VSKSVANVRPVELFIGVVVGVELKSILPAVQFVSPQIAHYLTIGRKPRVEVEPELREQFFEVKMLYEVFSKLLADFGSIVV
jgi:hypothetical protein